MKLVNRYILRELFKLFFGVLAVISIAFVIQRLILLTEWSMHRGVGMLGVMKLLACLFPSLFLTSIPLVSLFVIIIVLSQLSEDNELVVMMSCGRDLMSLARPVLIFSSISALLTAYLAFILAPDSMRWFESTRWNLVQTKSESAIPTQTFVEFAKDSQIYVQNKDEQGLKNLIIYEEGESDWPLSGGAESQNFIFAKRARVQNKGLEAESWIMLENGAFVSHQQSPELDQFVKFEKALARIDLEGAKQLNKRLQRLMQSQEINQLVEIIKNPPKMKDKDNIKFGITILEDARIEFSQRINQILACLLLTLWGIGLGIKPPRTSRTVSYLVGAAAGFGFYYLNIFFKALALKKMMSIEIALFSPTILILLSGAWLLQERRHGKEPLGFLYQFDEYVRQRRAEKKHT